MNFLKDTFRSISEKKNIKQMDRDAEEIYGKGYVLFELGRYEETLEKYKEAEHIWTQLYHILNEKKMEVDANRALARTREVNFNMCFVLFRLNRFEEALSIIEKVLEENKGNPKLYFSKGFIELNLRRFDDAINTLEQALKIDQNYADAWYCKGNACYELGEYQEALRAYEKALENADTMHFNFPRYSFLNISPEPKLKTNCASIHYSKGHVYHQLNDENKALECFTEALKIDPTFSHAWYCRAVALKSMDENDEALESIEQALKFNPEVKEAWSLKADILTCRGNDEEAKECLEKASGCKEQRF